MNLLATAGLLFALFILVNFVANRRYLRHDFSRQQLTALSSQTTQTLAQLSEPLSVIVFYQPSHRLYELVRDQLKEYERASTQVRVEFVDPQQDIARAKQLVKEFEIDVNSPEALNLVIFKSGTRHKYLSDTDLADYDYEAADPMAGPRVKAFKGEAAFTSAIINVTRKSQTLVWATTGHGEKSLSNASPQGLADFKRLLEQQDVSVQEVTLLERPEVAPDVQLLLIVGPTRRFPEAEVAMVETFLTRGGRLLALIDPLDDTGLDALLARWGIALGRNIVVDPESMRRLPFVSAANLLVTDYTEHPIVSKMQTLMTLFPLARSVSPAQPAPSGITTTPLALTSAAGWGETQTGNERFEFAEGEDLKGPVSIAAAAERTEPSKTRVVAIGDSDFLINAQLGNAGNKDLVMGALYWLIEQEQLIGISPKTVEAIKLILTGGQLSGIFWLSFAGLPLAFGLLGVAMWWIRRQ
ncbi:MAG: GldG family protein [Candidatus Omnitrophica bacterium]|nr:GldG family protein [Candidatus Omnitrophota bacterium]